MSLLAPVQRRNVRMSSLGSIIEDSERRVSSRIFLSNPNFFWYDESKKWMKNNRIIKAAKLFIINSKESIASLDINGNEDYLRIKIIRGYIYSVSYLFFKKHIEKGKKFKVGIDYESIFVELSQYIQSFKEILKMDIEDLKEKCSETSFEMKFTKPKYKALDKIDRKKQKKAYADLEIYFSSFIRCQLCIALYYQSIKKYDLGNKILFSLDKFCNDFSFYFNSNLLHLQAILCSLIAKVLLENQTEMALKYFNKAIKCSQTEVQKRFSDFNSKKKNRKKFFFKAVSLLVYNLYLSSIVYEIKNDFSKMMESISCAFWLTHQFYHEKYFFSLYSTVEQQYFSLKDKYGGHMQRFSQILSCIENVISLMEKESEGQYNKTYEMQKRINTQLYHKHNLEAISSLLIFQKKGNTISKKLRNRSMTINFDNPRLLMKRKSSIEGETHKRFSLYNKGNDVESVLKRHRRTQSANSPKRKKIESEEKFVFSKFRKQPRLLTTDRYFRKEKRKEFSSEDYSYMKSKAKTNYEKHFQSVITENLRNTNPNYKLSDILKGFERIKENEKFDKTEFALGKAILKIKKRENGLIEGESPRNQKLPRKIMRQCDHTFNVIKAESKVSEPKATTARKSWERKSQERKSALVRERRVSMMRYLRTDPSTNYTTFPNETEGDDEITVDRVFTEAKDTIFEALDSYEKRKEGHEIDRKVEIKEEMKALADSTDLMRYRRIRKSDYYPNSFSNFVRDKIFDKRAKNEKMVKMRNVMKKIRVILNSENSL